MSFQELATRVSHRNTGKVTDDPIADKMLARISKDENLHMVFYRNIVAAALEIAPDETMRAIADEVIGFEMPGATMAGFRRNSMIIAKAGIYDLRLHHDEVIMPILRHWDVFDRGGIGAVGERARDELAAFLEGWTRRPRRFVERRAEDRARAAAPVRHRRDARHRLLSRAPAGRAGLDPVVVVRGHEGVAARRRSSSARRRRLQGLEVAAPGARPARSAAASTPARRTGC